MPSDQEEQLEKSRNRWKAVAIASLILVFVVMLPFTVVMNEVIGTFWSKKGLKTKVVGVTATVGTTVKRPSKDDAKNKVSLRAKGDSDK